MNNEGKFELNGEHYRWSGSEWINAQTRVSVSRVIQRELTLRYGHLMGVELTSQKRPNKVSKSSKSKEIQETIGPIMLDFIRCRYSEIDDYVPRDEIRDYLLNHSEASAFLRLAYSLTEEKRTFEWYVGNQVDWLSANLEDPSRSEFKDLLEKGKMVDGKKGFRPRA